MLICSQSPLLPVRAPSRRWSGAIVARTGAPCSPDRILGTGWARAGSPRHCRPRAPTGRTLVPSGSRLRGLARLGRSRVLTEHTGPAVRVSASLCLWHATGPGGEELARGWPWSQQVACPAPGGGRQGRMDKTEVACLAPGGGYTRRLCAALAVLGGRFCRNLRIRADPTPFSPLCIQCPRRSGAWDLARPKVALVLILRLRHAHETGSADRRQTAQRAACGDVLRRAGHFVRRVTSCAEGNESRSPSAQSVTLCAKCSPGRRTGPLHQETGGPPHPRTAAATRPAATGPADGPPKTAQTQQRKAPVTAPRRPPTSWASSPHYTGRRRPAGAGCGPLSRPRYRGRELL